MNASPQGRAYARAVSRVKIVPVRATKIGSYTVVGKIGEGGMGAVYKAHDPALERDVALKILPPKLAADAEFVQRFKHEAAAAAKLSHPNLVQVFAAGEDTGRHFIAMEFVEGESLGDHLQRQGHLRALDALSIAMHAAEALRYAWNKAKIVHRDVKPDNILLSVEGDVKVADLGLAQRIGRPSATAAPGDMLIGSPHCISPELVRGDREIDFHSDIYSLGCTLFNMLTGHAPFEGPDPVALFYKHVNEQPPDLARVCPECPPKLVQLVKRMMAKSPPGRPASFDALIGEMADLHRELDYERTHLKERAAAQERRTTVKIYGGAAAAVVLLLGFLIWNGLKSHRNGAADPAPTPAPAPAVALPSAATAPPPARATSPAPVARGPEADAFIRDVAALPADAQVKRVVARLKELNPGFDGQASHKIEKDTVTEFQFRVDAVTDISPVRALSGLRRLWLGGTNAGPSRLSDLGPLRGLKLETLYFDGTAVEDLTPLIGMPLSRLGFNRSTNVRDLSPLQGLDLVMLGCQNSGVRDLGPLRNMRHLSMFYCTGSEVRDLAPLRDVPLQTLQCSGTAIADFLPIRNMPLTSIVCDYKLERDADVLRSIKTLQTINNVPVADFWNRVGAVRPAGTDASAAVSRVEIVPDGSEADWSKAIDLLAMIDPQKDAVTGEWTVANGRLTAVPVSFARLQLPYHPPEEYDFRVVFARESRFNSLWQIVVGGGRQFDWCTAGFEGKWFGFESIGGINSDRNASRVAMERNLENGRPYTSLVEVRKGGARAFLDGRFIAEWKTDYGDMSLPSPLRMPDPHALGIGAHTSGVTYQRIEVREVSGRGTFTRPPPAPTPVDDAFVRGVAALPAEQQVVRVVAKLKELNPQFDGKETHKVEAGAVTELSISSVGVTDLSPLKALSWLKKLAVVPATLGQKGALADLSPLKDLPLTMLWCHHNPIREITPLKGLPLTTLSITGTQVSDLWPLARMRLTMLGCNETEVDSLRPLEGMPLTTLWCQNTKVTELDPLAAAPLRELRCDPAVAAQHAAVLRDIKTLAKVNDQTAAAFLQSVSVATGSMARGSTSIPAYQRSAISVLAPKHQIERFVDEMKKLNPIWDGLVDHEARGSKVTILRMSAAGVSNIAPVRAFEGLEEFHCVMPAKDGKPIGGRSRFCDLTPLAGLPLVKLNCSYTSVSDLDPLRGMKLESLSLTGALVTNLAALEGMPIKNFSAANLSTLTDLTPLKGMPIESLMLDSTRVTDLVAVGRCPLKAIYLRYGSVKDLAPLRGMPLERVYLPYARAGIDSLEPLADCPIKILDLTGTKVDLAPLKGIPLVNLWCNFAPGDEQILRSIKTLEKINTFPPAEFWRRVASGEAHVP